MDEVERVRVARQWSAVFVDRPDVLAALLADLLKQAYALPGRIGQRPMPYESDVDLASLIYGDYTEDPIGEALPRLMGMTTTSYAHLCGVPEEVVTGVMLPRSHPAYVSASLDQLEALAAGAGKPPYYFVEWRVLAVSDAFAALLQARPGLATALFRNHVRFSEEFDA